MNKLRTQAIIAFSVFLLFVVGGASIFYLLFAEDFYIAKKITLMDSSFESIRQLDIAHITDAGEPLIQSLEDESFSFIICDENFEQLYSSNIRHTTILIDNTMIPQKEQFSTHGRAIYHKNEDRKPITLMGLIEQDGSSFYVYIYEYTTVIRRSVDYANRFLVEILILSLVLGIGFSWIISSKIVKPVQNISSVANMIAENDFSVRAAELIPTYELKQLAHNINQMADKIQRDMNDLNNYNYLLLKQNRNMAEFEDIRKKFVTNVTHELKTPLAIISSQVEMLQYEYDDSKKDYYFSSIMEEIDKMSNLISNILHNSFTEMPLPNTMMSKDNLTVLLNTLIPKFNTWLTSKEIICVSQIEQDCYAVYDTLQIEQVINNYILNASKHTLPGHKIIISLRCEENSIYFSVYNEGKIIPDSEQEYIWKSFYQGRGKNQKKSDSSEIGLGLYIAKDIINLHEGSCGFFNRQQGVEFWFRLSKA